MPKAKAFSFYLLQQITVLCKKNEFLAILIFKTQPMGSTLSRIWAPGGYKNAINAEKAETQRRRDKQEGLYIETC